MISFLKIFKSLLKVLILHLNAAHRIVRDSFHLGIFRERKEEFEMLIRIAKLPFSQMTHR
ncbi:hypothetical protein D3C84_1297130 [compost metagenome]